MSAFGRMQTCLLTTQSGHYKLNKRSWSRLAQRLSGMPDTLRFNWPRLLFPENYLKPFCKGLIVCGFCRTPGNQSNQRKSGVNIWIRRSPFKKVRGLKVSSQKDFRSQENGQMLQSGSNSDKIFDLKRCFAQSGGLSVNLNVHMGNLD